MQYIYNKIKEIKKLIYVWNARILTPYGKITIVKRLLISKITHILLSLPSPNLRTFEELENLFKKFIWNQKTPKFRKEIMENLKDLGGLKMTNIRIFDAALKISWLKRIVSQTGGWAEFPHQFHIQNIIAYGDQYPSMILNSIKNKFWSDMVKSAERLMNNFTIRNVTHVHLMPLWYNSDLNFEFRRSWKNKGYLFIFSQYKN